MQEEQSVANATVRNLPSHIMPTSATMVGVCMTVISIIKVLHTGSVGHVIDKILAADSVLFLGSTFLSYLSIRSVRRAAPLENWADNAFMLGLLLMVFGAIAFSFEFFY